MIIINLLTPYVLYKKIKKIFITHNINYKDTIYFMFVTILVQTFFASTITCCENPRIAVVYFPLIFIVLLLNLEYFLKKKNEKMYNFCGMDTLAHLAKSLKNKFKFIALAILILPKKNIKKFNYTLNNFKKRISKINPEIIFFWQLISRQFIVKAFVDLQRSNIIIQNF